MTDQPTPERLDDAALAEIAETITRWSGAATVAVGSRWAAAELSRLLAELRATRTERDELRTLLRERHMYPEYPMPADGEMADEAIMVEREAWSVGWNALVARVEAALATQDPALRGGPEGA